MYTIKKVAKSQVNIILTSEFSSVESSPESQGLVNYMSDKTEGTINYLENIVSEGMVLSATGSVWSRTVKLCANCLFCVSG